MGRQSLKHNPLFFCAIIDKPLLAQQMLTNIVSLELSSYLDTSQPNSWLIVADSKPHQVFANNWGQIIFHRRSLTAGNNF